MVDVIDESQNPCSTVNLTLEMILYMQSMLKNFMAFNLDWSVIGGSRFTCSSVMVANVVCMTASSFCTTGKLTSGEISSPRFERTERQLPIASLYFEEDANSFASKLLDVKLSSNDFTLAMISCKQVDILLMSPCMQLTDADNSKS